MKWLRDESGQTLVFTVLCMAILIGFMGVAIDVGTLFRAQRKIQTAADAAAIAGTLEYYFNGSANVTSVAKTAASNNGITDTNQVTVNLPPVNGWHTGSAFVEVIIQQPNPTIFMGTFGQLFGSSSLSPTTVSSRAVGGIVPSEACNYVLNKTSPGSATIKGGATINSPGCSWKIDSTSPEALCITGNNALNGFNTPGVLLTVAQQKAKSCNKLYPGGQVTGVSNAGDPLASRVTIPNPASACTAANTVTAATVTSATTILSSSTSTGGFSSASSPISYSITCFSAANVLLSSVTLGTAGDDHLYLFENGVTMSGNITINGTMDLDGGNFCQGSSNCYNNNSLLTMTAPANTFGTGGTPGNTYAWNGLSLIVPGYNTAPTCNNSYGGPNYSPPTPPATTPVSCLQLQFGSGSGTLTGMIYAPTASLFMQDSGGSIGVAGFIVDSIFVNSNLTITNSYPYAHPDSPLNQVALVE
jgi:hypothetical protein